jgi:ribosomal subunit interface protein
MVNINFQVRAEKFQDSTKEYIQEKIDRVEKLLDKHESFTVKIDPVSNSKSRYTIYRVELTVKMPQAFIKVENKGANINKTFDKLIDPLQKKLTRYQGQNPRWSKQKEWKLKQILPDTYLDEDHILPFSADFTPNIKRKIYDDNKPLHPAEAVEKMELLGNNCYLFTNIENNEYAMLYKVDDSNYTLVQPGK